MKEPVLQDKRLEHVKFCKFATELIEMVSGKQSHKYSVATLDDIRKVMLEICLNKSELDETLWKRSIIARFVLVGVFARICSFSIHNF